MELYSRKARGTGRNSCTGIWGTRTEISTHLGRLNSPSGSNYAAEKPAISQIRITENREIGVLNDRHADYISEVRFLQAVQRKLRLRLEQWMKAGKPRVREDMTESLTTGGAKARYDADAEKIPRLNDELNSTRSRYESAVRGRDLAAEDSLLVRLCDLRSQLCLAKGRGKVIQEECARLRKENQKIVDDIASQRQIFDKETQERYSYERRARPLLQECEELLKSYKEIKVPVPRYSTEDIERDRKHFRAEVEASMVEIRRQYEILASTVKSEMEQWYKDQVSGIEFKQRDDTSSFKKRLADLRDELVDVRTRLSHLEERNRLLTSLIADFEEARDQEQKLSASTVKEDEDNLRKLIERYNELVSGAPRDKRYSVATLRAEIMRYRELLDGVGPRDNRDISNILQSVFERMDSSIAGRRTSQAASSGAGGMYEPYGTRRDIGGPTETRDYRYTSSTRTSQSAGFGGGARDEGSTGLGYSSRVQPTTVTSTADYTLRDERGSRTGGRDYAMQRSAQGNVTIGRVARDGSYVTIENTSMDIDQHIGEWTLRSTSSSLKQVSFTFPRGFILAPQSTVQIFARGKGPNDPPRSLVCEAESTFATGEDLAMYLYDNYGQERARLTQREFFATYGDSGF